VDAEVSRLLDELLPAIDALDHKRVAEISGVLAATARSGQRRLPLPQAKDVLDRLRRKRYFAEMQAVADAVIQAGERAGRVRRHYAQALIDQGTLTAAAAVLRELVMELEDLSAEARERTEARGLLGRVYKQMYVGAVGCGAADGRDTDHTGDLLREAIRWYHEPFSEARADNYWHGINAVALAMRARRDRVAQALVAEPEQIAREVLQRIREQGDAADAWQLATALEACIALADEDAALGRAVMYTEHQEADAFELASTLRQLEEVWCLDSTRGVGKRILPLLRGALLKRETGGFEVTGGEVREAAREAASGDEASAARLEKVFGRDAYTSHATYAAGMQRARTVARIGREVGGHGDGTGFLVRGADLSERFRGEEWLLLTNAHVISTEPEHQPAVRMEEAVITFQGLPPASGPQVRAYRAQEVLHVSGPTELDFAVIKLDGAVEGITAADACEVAPYPPNKEKGRVYIIGHPAGGSLSYSLQDNLLLDYDAARLHYRTPTEGGSSGSPVYTTLWKLVGLHHAGSHDMPCLNGRAGTYEANEGIRMDAIRQALA
jgi:hypothetical protein